MKRPKPNDARNVRILVAHVRSMADQLDDAIRARDVARAELDRAEREVSIHRGLFDDARGSLMRAAIGDDNVRWP